MKGKLRKKWITVATIWTVVLILTGWNIHLVNRIQSRRQELETLQMDLRFLDGHQSSIEKVRRQRLRLTHSVQSFGLGFLVVENDLKKLSRRYGLQELRVEAEENPQSPVSVPIKIFTTGSVPAIMGWIAAVENAYPYLVIANMDIACDPHKGTNQLRATFNYCFTLSEPERVG